jgi:hypothetical protein
LLFCALISLVFLYSVQSAEAQVILEGDFLRTMAADDGTLGFEDPSERNIQLDPAGTGSFAEGAATNDRSYENFVVVSDQSGRLENNNCDDCDAMTGAVLDLSGTDFDNHALWDGDANDFVDVTNHYLFNDEDQVINVMTEIEAMTDLTDLTFLRSIDPDLATPTFGQGNGGFAAGDLVWARDGDTGETVALFTPSNINHNTGFFQGALPDDPRFFLAEDGAEIDEGILGLAFDLGTMEEGETVTLQYAYLLGIDLIENLEGGPDELPPGVIPLPSTVLLIGSGLLGLLGLRRRCL